MLRRFLVPHPVEPFPSSVIVLLRMVLIVVLDVDSLDSRCFEQSITPIVSMSYRIWFTDTTQLCATYQRKVTRYRQRKRIISS
jgi:hypothetical protein